MRRRKNAKRRFVVCVGNEGYLASLQLRKIYEQLPDTRGEEKGFIRLAEDEDGDSALFPANYFLPIELPHEIEGAIEARAEMEAAHP